MNESLGKVTKLRVLDLLNTKPKIDVFYDYVLENIEIIGFTLDIIETDHGALKLYAEKMIRLISEKNPKLIYPHFDTLVNFTKNSNFFIKWGFIITLSNMILIDKDHKFDDVYEYYLSLINDSAMVTAGNVIKNAWKFVEYDSKNDDDITKKLISIENNTYLYKNEESEECKNILIGNVIECFNQYYDLSKNKQIMMDFAFKHQNNPRKFVAQKARNFIHSHQVKK